ALENVLKTTYNDSTCFLALSLLYDERNWGTIDFSIDHLFSRDSFKKPTPDHLKELRDDFGNLALVIGDENAGKKALPLGDCLATWNTKSLSRNFIHSDQLLWAIKNFE